jgi:TRAP-type C4-dicarboxylate transport system permease small subunit
MAKKRKAAANKRGSRKRPARGRASADQTVNTLVILVVIVIVLGGLYLYAQNNKKQAALLSLSPALATITAPLKAVFTRVIAVTPSAQPATQQTLQLPEPAAGPDERQPVALIEAK